jgi:YggT family protein
VAQEGVLAIRQRDLRLPTHQMAMSIDIDGDVHRHHPTMSGTAVPIRPQLCQDIHRSRRTRVPMGDTASSMLLLDAVGAVQNFLDVFITVYILVILAYIITSWIRLPYSPTLNRIQRFLYDVCDPYLRLFRRVVPPLGPLDLSPMLAVIVLLVVQQLLHALLDRL